MNAVTITNERFRELLDAYGANPMRWPETEREAALALVEASAEARGLRDEVAAFDRLIDLADTAPATAKLEARILATFPPSSRASGLRAFLAGLIPGHPVWVPASALALSLALGLAVGAFVPAIAGLGSARDQDTALIALGDADSGLWDDGEEGS